MTDNDTQIGYFCSLCKKMYRSETWAFRHLNNRHDGMGWIDTWEFGRDADGKRYGRNTGATG